MFIIKSLFIVILIIYILITISGIAHDNKYARYGMPTDKIVGEQLFVLALFTGLLECILFAIILNN